MSAINQTKKTVLALDIRVARSFFERVRGLIGSSSLEPGEGFLIPSCKGIHTFGMNYPIDAIYINRGGEVIGIMSHLAPNSIGIVNFRAHSVLELPPGVIEGTHTEVGDLISILSTPSSEIPLPVPDPSIRRAYHSIIKSSDITLPIGAKRT